MRHAGGPAPRRMKMGQTAIFRRGRLRSWPVQWGHQGLAEQSLVSPVAKNGVSPDFQERLSCHQRRIMEPEIVSL